MKKYRFIKQSFIIFLIAVLSAEMPLSVYAEPAGEAVSENDTKEAFYVPIDEEHFPDRIFRQYVEETFDFDDDGSLSGEEIADVFSMDVSGMHIKTLQGIGYFTQLQYLDCSYNRLSQLETQELYLTEITADHNAYLFTDDEAEDFLDQDREIYTERVLIPDTDITTTEVYTGEEFADTEITKELFKDEIFAEYVEAYFDEDQDGALSAEEAAEVTVMDVSGWGIRDLCGISCFKNLVYLNYADNPVTTPDLSANIYLLEVVSGEEKEADEEEVSENEIPDAPSLSDNSISANGLIQLSEEPKGAVAEQNTESDEKETETIFTVGTPKLSNVKNSAKGKASVSFSPCTNAAGYEVEYSRKSSFASGVVVTDTKKTSITVTNLPKNKTYYFRVRAYGVDTKGNTVYGAYSNVISVKIKKGVTESKYSANAGKVKSCKVVKKDTFSFKASVKKRIAGSDDCYYLCQVDPYTDKRVRTVAAVGKTTSVSVSLPLTDESGMNLIEGKYALFIKDKGKYKKITNSAYISNPEAAAAYTAAFPKAASKKGLQGALGKTDLGVSHTLINIPLTDVIATKETGIPYVYNGKTYYFKRSPYTNIIRYCNQQNVTISAVFLLPWDKNLKSLISPKGRKAGVANYYAWNTSTQASRETFEAVFMYLAELYSRENCHLDNWILGNELNAGYMWNYAGHVSYEQYINICAESFRIMYYAAVSHNKNARVYISLTHTWLRNNGEYGAKDFMTDFNQNLKSKQKNIKWNLAYHAYPAPLTDADFWNNSLAGNSQYARYVNLNNLNILTDFVKKNFGKKTHIILSEQGFTSTSGQNTQAAAIAYGYYIAEFNSMIDSFIIRSDMDNAVETSQGLKMGLCSINGKPKPAYNVFKYMDTPQYKAYTKGCLKTLGKSNWKSLVKGFKESRLKKMPSRAE